MHDENRVLPVSSLLTDYREGISDVCLSVPCIVNRGGEPLQAGGRFMSISRSMALAAAAALAGLAHAGEPVKVTLSTP